MEKHIELNESQQEFIKGHFIDGEGLFDLVEDFGTSRGVTLIIFTSTDKGIIVHEDYLRDLEWIAAYPTGAEVKFARRRK